MENYAIHEDLDWNKFTPREIERLISPWRFIQAKDKQTYVDNHVFEAESKTREAQSCIPCKVDVSYGPRDSEKFDIYGTDLPPGGPVFLWVHGGGWVAGGKEWSGFHVTNLYAIGVKCVVVGHPLAPDATIGEMCGSISAAVMKAMELFEDAEFFLGGHSAGAHLISSSVLFNYKRNFETNPTICRRIKGFILVSGLFDLRPVRKTSMNEILQLTNEESIDLSPILNTAKIPEHFLSTDVIIMLGKDDPPEFHRQGRNLNKELQKRGLMNTEYWESNEDDHFSIIQNFAKSDSLACSKLLNFIKRGNFKFPLKLRSKY